MKKYGLLFLVLFNTTAHSQDYLKPAAVAKIYVCQGDGQCTKTTSYRYFQMPIVNILPPLCGMEAQARAGREQMVADGERMLVECGGR